MLLSGVRNSCDMLARNSDLYFEVSVQLMRFVLQRETGLFDVAVAQLPSHFLHGDQTGFFLELVVGVLEPDLLVLEFAGERFGLAQKTLRVRFVFERNPGLPQNFSRRGRAVCDGVC